MRAVTPESSGTPDTPGKKVTGLRNKRPAGRAFYGEGVLRAPRHSKRRRVLRGVAHPHRASSGDARLPRPRPPSRSPRPVESLAGRPASTSRASRRGAAGEWTFGTHLKTRAVHALLVVAFVSGPVALLGLGVGLGAGTRAEITTAPAMAVTADPGPAERASAAAERLVSAWLSANRDDVDALQTQLAQPVTDLDLELPNTRPAAPTRIWIDDLTALPNRRWTVIVGALTGAAGTASYYTVPVQTDDLGAVALTLPARTTGPVKAAAGDLDGAGTSLSLSDPAAVTAAGYLAALTGGTDDIDRWTSPGAPLPAIEPSTLSRRQGPTGPDHSRPRACPNERRRRARRPRDRHLHGAGHHPRCRPGRHRLPVPPPAAGPRVPVGGRADQPDLDPAHS